MARQPLTKTTMPRNRVFDVRNDVDLVATECVDMMHHWRSTGIERAASGKLRGLPVRIAVCLKCDSTREDHLTWSGQVVARRYHHDEAYIQGARALSDDMHERRQEYRKVMLERYRQQYLAELGNEDSAEASA